MKTIYFILVGILLFSCGDKRSKLRIQKETAANASMLTSAEVFTEEISLNLEVTPQMQVNISERKLIRSGSIHFKTKNVVQTKKEMGELVKSLDGYVSKESQQKFEDGVSYSQVVRIPLSQFDELLQKIEKMADKVDSKTLESEDVTEEFIDVSARLKTKRDLERRYAELLGKAHKVDELLSIEREMADVRSEIESMQGRLNFIENQVSYSTLDVTYYEQSAIQFSFASKFVTSLGQGWHNLPLILVGLTAVWPFLIIGAGVVAYLIHYRHNRAEAKSSEA